MADKTEKETRNRETKTESKTARQKLRNYLARVVKISRQIDLKMSTIFIVKKVFQNQQSCQY